MYREVLAWEIQAKREVGLCLKLVKFSSRDIVVELYQVLVATDDETEPEDRFNID